MAVIIGNPLTLGGSGGGGGGGATLIEKVVNANGVYIAANEEADGYSRVSVNVPQPTTLSKTITANGVYNSSEEDAAGYYRVIVNVPTSSAGRCPRAEQTVSYPLQTFNANFSFETSVEKV